MQYMTLKNNWWAHLRVAWAAWFDHASAPGGRPHEGIRQGAKASPRAFLAQWFAMQPSQSRIVLTVDSASSELLALEAVPENQLPAALHTAMAANHPATWQARGPRQLQRMNYQPATLPVLKQEALAALEDLTSARIIAAGEVMRIDHKLLIELQKLEAHLPAQAMRPAAVV